MKCIICGKKLIGNQRKYCCPQHAQLGYKCGMATTLKDQSKKVSDLYKRFKKSFNCSDSFYCNGGFLMRIFVSACLQDGCSAMSIARGIGKHHSCVYHHKGRILKSEEKIAKEFLENKDYVYGSKYNGFTYGAK